MKKILAIAFILIIFISFSQAQSPRVRYHISNGWSDINLSGKIKGKFSWQLENQHRREDEQGDYNENTTTGNIYNNLNQHVLRPYIHYQANPNVRLSLMPLGWIGSNRFKEGSTTAFFAELRVAPQVIFSQSFGRLKIDNRMRYEFRWFGNNQAVSDFHIPYSGDFSNTVFKMRYRNQFKVSLPLNHPKMQDKTLYFQAYDEVFVNLGSNVASTNLLDQNRVLVGLGYRLNQFVSVEAGYMKQSIFRFNNASKNNEDINNIFQINLAVNNIEKLFGK